MRGKFEEKEWKALCSYFMENELFCNVIKEKAICSLLRDVLKYARGSSGLLP